jgi:hypothetical protein
MLAPFRNYAASSQQWHQGENRLSNRRNAARALVAPAGYDQNLGRSADLSLA